MEIQWLDYLYSNRKSELFDIIRSYNMPLPESMDELYECVQILIDQNGKSAEEKILKIHPEYSGIEKLVLDQQGKQKLSSASYHNFSGEEPVSKVMELQLNRLERAVELNNMKQELDRMKTFQNVMLLSIAFLIYHNFKK